MVALQNQTNKPGQAVLTLPWAHPQFKIKTSNVSKQWKVLESLVVSLTGKSPRVLSRLSNRQTSKVLESLVVSLTGKSPRVLSRLSNRHFLFKSPRVPSRLYNRHSISFHFHIFFIKLKINKTKHFSDRINQTFSLQREYV